MKEEDRLLLTSLGVVSANPDDIEHQLLAKAENRAHENISQPAQVSNGGKTPEREEGNQENLLTKVQIHAQLRALEAEIAAVSAGLEIVQSIADKDSESSEGEKDENDQDSSEHKPFVVGGGVLQRALATERLRSLKQKRGQLKKHLKAFEGDGKTRELEEHKVLLDSVKNKEEAVIKGTGHLLDKPTRGKKKIVSLQEDDEFDAALDAATSGLIETERDKLIRKGVLTPFDQVKGFERRVQRSRPTEDDGDKFSLNSVSKASRSLSALSIARHSTKLLDAADLPKLNPPTHEFRRLRRPVNIQESNEVEKPPKDQTNHLRKRTRQPVPDQYWRKATSSDDEPWNDSDHHESYGIYCDIMCKDKQWWSGFRVVVGGK